MPDQSPVADAAESELVTLTVGLVRYAATLSAGLAATSGLAPTDATALRALDLMVGGEQPVGALGRELGLSSGAMTGLIDRLERAGLAQRHADPGDRRRVLVSLTPRARAFGAAQLRPLLDRVVAAAGRLPAEQRTAVRDFLAAILPQTGG